MATFLRVHQAVVGSGFGRVVTRREGDTILVNVDHIQAIDTVGGVTRIVRVAEADEVSESLEQIAAALVVVDVARRAAEVGA